MQSSFASQRLSKLSSNVLRVYEPRSIMFPHFQFLLTSYFVFALQRFTRTPVRPLVYSPNSSLGIPTFSSHEEHRKHILIHTAAVFRDFSRKGFTEGMSGHISVRDPEFEDYIWMNPLGKHFGLMTAGDLICLDIKTGKQVGGNRVLPMKTFT